MAENSLIHLGYHQMAETLGYHQTKFGLPPNFGKGRWDTTSLLPVRWDTTSLQQMMHLH